MTNLSRNSRCECGSGKRYKHCCGTTGILDESYWLENSPGRFQSSLLDSRLSFLVENEPVYEESGERYPPGLLVKQLGEQYDWQALARGMIRNRTAGRLGVQAEDDGTKSSIARITNAVDQGEYAGKIIELVRQLYIEEIEPFYNVKLRWFEKPMVLRYEPGGYYRPHADSDALNASGKWERCNDRHLSFLLYLDDDFEGGDLTFPNFSYRIRPRPGLMVAFPSDGRYLHAAMPVTSGRRHAIVSWSCAVGSETIGLATPDDAILRDG